MVHGLVAQLGGGLTIVSKLGEGSKIELWLPVSADSMEEKQVAHTAVAPPVFHGCVLVIDDEKLVRQATAFMLSDLGYEVVEASSAQIALDLIADGLDPALIVTDHLMPGMNGAELARHIRAERPDLPVLIVSGYSDADGIAPDLSRLTKPFRTAELARKISEL
jgi:CheY-like chemotaxis protein